MGKRIITILFVAVLLSPQAELEAKGRYHFQHGNPHQFMGFPHATRAKLESLNRDIEAINAQIDNLKLLVGDLPVDLADTLDALRIDVDTNSADVELLLEQLGNILGDDGNRLDSLEAAVMGLVKLNLKLGDLESRISKLEQAGSPNSDIVFSGDFTFNAEASVATQEAWVAFRANATGAFSSIEIRNPIDGKSVRCTDATSTTLLAMGLNSSKPTSLLCNNLTWNVGFCGTQTHAIELNAGLSSQVCQCFNEQYAVVRPRMGNPNWGGIGGYNCGLAPDQTIEVILTR